MSMQTTSSIGIFAHSLLWISIIFILLNVFITFYQTKDFSATLSIIGKEFLNPLSQVGDDSAKIIQNGGIYITSSSLITKIGETLYSYWGFFSHFYILFLWILILSKIWGFLIGNSTNFLASYSLALFSYFGLLIIYLLLISKESILTPYYSISTLLQALPLIVSPIAVLADKIIHIF